MYGSIADFRAYALARGNNAPTAASDDDATAALVRASDMVRLRYVANLLPGYDTTLQPTGFEHPLVEEASYIAAGLELSTPNFFSQSYTPAQQKVLTGVGQISWTVTGDARSKFSAMPVSTLIEALFEPYVVPVDPPYFSFRAIGTSNV